MHFSMTQSHGLRLVAGAALVTVLGGCLSGADESAEDRQARANSLKFIQESSAPISAKFSAEAPVPGSFVIRQNYTNPQHEIIVDNLKAIGCPKLANLFEDMLDYQGSVDNPFPQSFHDYLSCFGISVNATPDDIDIVYEKFQNPTELLDCICGGTGLTDYLNSTDFQWSVFSGTASTAAGAAFSGGQSSASGAEFSGSQSSASGSEFSGN